MTIRANDTPATRRLSEQISMARADRSVLSIVGQGSKRFYGERVSGIALPSAELTGICSYEPSELVVTAKAGTTLSELEQTLRESGQALAFDPPQFGGGGTVGGMVAAGLSGPARPSVGAVRDFVLGLTMLNGLGDLLSFGGRVMKNVAGYDIPRLMTGSMGTLGFICEVSLKVAPLPADSVTLVSDCDEAEALRRFSLWRGQSLPVNAGVWVDGTLHVRLSGAAAAVRAARLHLGGTSVSADGSSAWWRSIRDHRHWFFADSMRSGQTPIWRISCDPAAGPFNLPGAQLIDWCGAQRWLRTDAPAVVVREAAALAGGHATLFYAPPDGTAIFTPLAAPLARITERLQRSFDPSGVFATGRLYGNP